VVRYAAITGLQELAIVSIHSQTDLTRQILRHFDKLVEDEENLAIIARIWLAQKEIQTHINELLNQQLEPKIAIDWQATLEKLYARKRQEHPHPEGDPHKFRQVAAAILRGEG
jgi:phycocyanobilin lyase subunit beta